MNEPVDLTFGGERYLSMVVALNDVEGTQLGLLYVGVEFEEIVAEQRAAQREVLTATGIAMTIGAVIAVGLGLLFTRPVTALALAARRIRENDLQSPVPRVGPRELRDLGAAMDEMRLAIREARENLIGANERLSQRADDSAAGLAALTQELAVVHGVTSGLGRDLGEAMQTASEQLTRLDWVDGACTLLRRPSGELIATAQHGMRPGADDALQATPRRQFSAIGIEDVYIENADVRGPAQALVPHGIRALALLPINGARDYGLLAVSAEHSTESPRATAPCFAPSVPRWRRRSTASSWRRRSRRAAGSLSRCYERCRTARSSSTPRAGASHATRPPPVCSAWRGAPSPGGSSRSGCRCPASPSTACAGPLRQNRKMHATCCSSRTADCSRSPPGRSLSWTAADGA